MVKIGSILEGIESFLYAYFSIAIIKSWSILEGIESRLYRLEQKGLISEAS